MTGQYREERTSSLDGGLNLSRNPGLLVDSEASDLLNVDLDRDSAKASRGSVKFNNQVAPKPGVLFRPDRALTPLGVTTNPSAASVPLRSYGFLPYTDANDIGGDFVSDGAVPGSETFHDRRGKSFALECSFRLPQEEKLFEANTDGEDAPDAASDDAFVAAFFGYDEAIDDCTIILQKGGDRNAPISWFVGVTNVGGSSRNGQVDCYELTTGEKVPADRPSNYCLVFGWFDAPGPARPLNSSMRYDLSDPSAGSSGDRCTQSIRAFTVPHWVEPGVDYHVGVRLELDSAAISDSSWNGDGHIQVAVSEGIGPASVYGYSEKNQITYSGDLVSGVEKGDMTTSNLTVAHADVEGPSGQPRSHLLTNTATTAAQGSITLGTMSATASADGKYWGGSCKVRYYNNEHFVLRIAADVPSSTTWDLELVFDSDGVPSINAQDSDAFHGEVSRKADSDGWYQVDWSILTTSSNNGATLSLIAFAAPDDDGGGSADLANSTAGQGVYLDEIEFRQFDEAEPKRIQRHEPNWGVHVYKGPTDSLEYLTKYGIRYSARDAVFAGLGYRQAPRSAYGFIPFGMDSAPLEYGGFSMVDCSASTYNQLYSSGTSLTVSRATTSDDFVEIHQQRLTSSRSSDETLAPNGYATSPLWDGYGHYSTGACNAQALRGYRLVGTGDCSLSLKGMVLTVNEYSEGTPDTLSLLTDSSLLPLGATFATQSVTLRAFRWNQRPTVVGEVRFYGVVAEALSTGSAISPQKDSSGNTERDYTPSECTNSHAKHRLTVFYPPKSVPRPPGGYPVLMECASSFMTETSPASSISNASTGDETFQYQAVNRGWVFISVGTPGTDSTAVSGGSDDTVGCFSPFGHARWDDYDDHFHEKDLVWARQWVADNASSLGVDNDRVVVTAFGPAATAFAYACCGADRKLSSGSSQVQQSTAVAGFIGQEAIAWYPAYADSGTISADHFLDPSTGIRAATNGDASDADMRKASISRVFRESGAAVTSMPTLVSYDTGGSHLAVEVARSGNGDPSADDAYTDGVIQQWHGLIISADLATVGSAFHAVHSRHVTLDSVTSPLIGLHTHEYLDGNTSNYPHDAQVTAWLEAEFPIASEPIDRYYLDRRTQFSLRSEALLDDELEPGVRSLGARYPFDDGGGGVLRESVRSADGFLAPFQMGVSKSGERGGNRLFLSGEGEALVLDLTENPTFIREFEHIQRSRTGAVAIEMTLTLPEAYYGQSASSTDWGGNNRITGVPHIASWELKGSDSTRETQPKMVLSHQMDSTQTIVDGDAAGFTIWGTAGNDQEEDGRDAKIETVDASHNLWSENANWVGRRITIQFGLESSGSADSFHWYIACSSARDFLNTGSRGFSSIELGDQEALVRTAAGTVHREDVLRSIVTIGGCWDVNQLATGYQEANCRMILDEVRVFGVAAPGLLPATDTFKATYGMPEEGAIASPGEGKLFSPRCLPSRQLSARDMLHPLGEGVSTVNVVDGSRTVSAPGSAAFYEGEPEESLKALQETLLVVGGDVFLAREDHSVGTRVPELYYVSSNTESAITLETPFNGEDRNNARAASVRVIGYTDFEDDISLLSLPLGRGAAYTPGSTTVDDVTLSEPFFQNKAPLGVNWRMRVYSPLADSSSDFFPSWVRGTQAPRENPILGLKGMNSRLIAGAQGSLFEVDDRWREDGPTDDLPNALAFRARLGHGDIMWPEQGDRVVFGSSSTDDMKLDASNLFSGTAVAFDVWVRHRSLTGIQTIAWVGDLGADATGDDNVLWIRANRGKPQFCVRGSGTIDGSVTPEGGLWVCEGSTSLPVGEWTHLRWHLTSGSGSGVLDTPELFVNGSPVSVTVNASENGTSGDEWVSTHATQGSFSRLLLGCAKDRQSRSEKTVAFEILLARGSILLPQRHHGLMHALDGDLADFAVATTSHTSRGDHPAFNPHRLNYESYPHQAVAVRCKLQEGVGHKTKDERNSYGVIHSHPFISLFHEMGVRNQTLSFASIGNQLFVANGGRVVVEEEGVAAFAGVLPPAFAPDFEVRRSPLWVKNRSHVTHHTYGSVAYTGITVSGENGPVGAKKYGGEIECYHQSTRGRAYLSQETSTGMNWEPQDEFSSSGTARYDYLFVKGYVRFRSTAGKQIIWSRKEEADSGISLECRDGHLGFYWWDTELKKEIGMKTSSPVFAPGYVHYVNVRIQHPHNHSQRGNFLSSLFVNGLYKRMRCDAWDGTMIGGGETFDGDLDTTKEGVVLHYHTDDGDNIVTIDFIDIGSTPFADNDDITGDTTGFTATVDGTPASYARSNIVVRRFRKEDTTNAWETETTFDAKTGETPNSGGTMSNVKNCIGFPSGGLNGPNGTTAVGLVTHRSAVLYSGAVGGVVTASRAVFHEDMKGMIWQWGTGGASVGTTFRIKDVDSTTQITVVNDFNDSSSLDFSAVSSVQGGVFAGISMVESEDFDSSEHVDLGAYPISWMGSSLQGSEISGYTPFDGETWSFGWGVESGDNSFDFFEAAATDYIETGFDDFAGEIYSTGNALIPGALTFDGTNGVVHTAVDTASDDYTTQPNESLQVELSSESNGQAKNLVWTFPSGELAIFGATRFWVTFYDPLRDLESQPGPELLVYSGGGDITNSGSGSQTLLKDIPTRPGMWRRVYMSLYDQFDGFQVAEIQDDSSTSFFVDKTQDEIPNGRPLRFDRSPPPNCSIVASSQQQMFYLGLEGQPDGVLYSLPYQPHAVPRSYEVSPGTIVPGLFVADTGDDSEITGAHDLNGELIIFKRNAAIALTATLGTAIDRSVSKGVGCAAKQSLANLDNTLYWCDARGPFSFGGTGVPVYLGTKLEPYFSSTMDPEHLPRISAAINRRRNQYVFTSKRSEDDYTNERIAFEFDHETSGVFAQVKRSALHRITRYRDPNVVALAELDSRVGGPRRLVGGTEEGFVFWLDRFDGTRAGAGSDEDAFGAASTSAVLGSHAGAIFSSADDAMDTELEGPRGVRLRWRSDGEDQESVVLFASAGSGFHMERAVEGSRPVDGDTVTVGELLRVFQSKDFAFDAPGLHKKVYFIDVVRALQSSGSIYLDVHVDRSDEAFAFADEITVDLSDASFDEIDVQDAQFRKHYRVRMYSRADQSGVDFELLELSFRLAETENR